MKATRRSFFAALAAVTAVCKIKKKSVVMAHPFTTTVPSEQTARVCQWEDMDWYMDEGDPGPVRRPDLGSIGPYWDTSGDRPKVTQGVRHLITTKLKDPS
jgi:hypothetical protein